MDLTFEEAILERHQNFLAIVKPFVTPAMAAALNLVPSPVTCHKCHGSGYIQVQRNTAFGAMMTRQVCDVCGGTGKEIKEKCPTCHGTGHEQERHTIDVKVPAGVEDGQQMRLQQAGEAGTNGGPYGDLYIVFSESHQAKVST